MNSLKRKLIKLFQGEFAAQSTLSDAQADLDRREWERLNADIALYETGMQLKSQRMELYQANQLSDQTQRENWLSEEVDMRNFFSGRSCKGWPRN